MITILLVEDNQATRKLLKRIFTTKGFKVLDSDGNGNTIQIYESKKPDIVIINNNFETIEEIRSKDSNSKFILLTCDPRINRDKMYSWGIRVRFKPVRISDLISEINAIVATVKTDNDCKSESNSEIISQTSGRNRFFVQDSQESEDYEKT
ncbi:MAG: response regulator [Asgard group archaeon]|nr:response regulator [Asgard group archaeon]